MFDRLIGDYFNAIEILSEGLPFGGLFLYSLGSLYIMGITVPQPRAHFVWCHMHRCIRSIKKLFQTLDCEHWIQYMVTVHLLMNLYFWFSSILQIDVRARGWGLQPGLRGNPISRAEIWKNWAWFFGNTGFSWVKTADSRRKICICFCITRSLT